MDKFITEFSRVRSAILAAFTTAEIADGNQLTNVNALPDDMKSGFKAAIVSLERETGKDGTRKRFVNTDLAFDIFLVVVREKYYRPVQQQIIYIYGRIVCYQNI